MRDMAMLHQGKDQGIRSQPTVFPDPCLGVTSPYHALTRNGANLCYGLITSNYKKLTLRRAALEHNRPMCYRPLFLIFVAAANCVAAAGVAEPGQIVSKDQLIAPLAPEQDHPLPRVVIKVDEDNLSSAAGAKDVLVVHYRARRQDNREGRCSGSGAKMSRNNPVINRRTSR